MTALDVVTILVFVIGASAFAVFVLSQPARPEMRVDLSDQAEVAFLFKGPDLEHADRHGRKILQDHAAPHDWDALRKTFLPRFPDFPHCGEIVDGESLTLKPAGDGKTGSVSITRTGGMTRVSVLNASAPDPTNQYQIDALKRQVTSLTAAAETAPHPIWLMGADGQVEWNNTAYEDLYKIAKGKDSDPQFPLFADLSKNPNPPLNTRTSTTKNGSDQSLWYDITASICESGVVFHAIDISAVIKADIAQRNFVQTLAKTFAQLSIGLAIFDREQRLALFNPALVDLTSLPPEVLSSRPDMLSFFDRLRDKRMMPEPKNYADWRQKISDLIAAASDGHHQETWTLPTGQTYRVTGRPHPDGAIAFLIEDVTAEVSLTRNFRAELELGQSLLDTLEDGIAVFTSAGVLAFCNAAYRTLWKQDPDTSFADITIHDAISVWNEQSDRGTDWDEVRDFVLRVTERVPWVSNIKFGASRSLMLCLTPIATGATVVRFKEPSADLDASIPMVEESDA